MVPFLSGGAASEQCLICSRSSTNKWTGARPKAGLTETLCEAETDEGESERDEGHGNQEAAV